MLSTYHWLLLLWCNFRLILMASEMAANKEDLYLSLPTGRLGWTPFRDQVTTGKFFSVMLYLIEPIVFEIKIKGAESQKGFRRPSNSCAWSSNDGGYGQASNLLYHRENAYDCITICLQLDSHIYQSRKHTLGVDAMGKVIGPIL